MPKESIREKRIREKTERKAFYREKEKDRLNHLENIKNDLSDTNALKRQRSSMPARAVKLKSTLFVNDKVVMTSYDDESFLNTVVEKEIAGNCVNNKYIPGSFDIDEINHKIYLHCGGQTASVDNPSYKKNPGEDLIHAKSKLEQRFFGKTFNDNIHIQIIYNILDIEKTLAEYLNTIVFTLNNVTGMNNTSDFVGNLFSTVSYADFQSNPKYKAKYDFFVSNYLHNSRLEYYAPVFYNLLNTDKQRTPRDELQLYSILAFISQWRQFLFHAESNNDMYNPEKWMTTEQRKIINEVYDQIISNFKSSFFDINKTAINMLLLAKKIPEQRYDEFAKRFYDFAAKKRHKRFGISIDKLFNNITQPQNEKGFHLPSKTVYSTCVKYILYSYYLDNPQERIELIRSLRDKSREDGAKNEIYHRESMRLYPKIYETVFSLLSLKTTDRKDTDNRQKIKSAFEKEYMSADFLMFCKCVYFLTCFLNIREKKELISSLTFKFESIAGFIKVLQSQGETVSFSEKYDLFSISEKIAYQFQDLFGLSRMLFKNDDLPHSYTVWDDLFKSFGDKSEPEFLFDKENRTLHSFAKKHIFNAWQFSFLIHYASPTIIYNINHTPKLIKFVLDGMPDVIIDEYFSAFFGEKNTSRTEKTKSLMDIIQATSFSRDVAPLVLSSKNDKTKLKPSAQNHTPDSNRDNLIKKVSLYYTVPYLLIKNLLSVNSRYFIAFYSLERDHHLFYGGEAKNDYCRLAYELVKSKKNKSVLPSPKCTMDQRAIRIFRNKVVHINVLLSLNADFIKSLHFGKFEKYFELYHYLMQLQMSKDYASKKKTIAAECISTKCVLDDVKCKYHTYNRDFVKMICYPFSYNTPRYRNLTENVLFYPHKYNTGTYKKYANSLDNAYLSDVSSVR